MKQHKYNVLAQQIIEQIQQKRIITGEKLPSIRQLCSKYGISKNTVIQALHLLETKKVIESRAKSGFYVTSSSQRDVPQKPNLKGFEPVKVEVPEIFQDIMMRSAAFDILPNEPASTPHSSIITLHRHINKAMRTQPTKKINYYDEPRGLKDLRWHLKEHYRSIGLNKKVDDYCITSGCQHSLFLALMATCKPGDNVAVESPGFYGVLQLIQQLQLNVIEIPSSPVTGLDIEGLEVAASKWGIKACVVTPAFATPTGASMTDPAKSRLVELANFFNFAVIEDDIYGDIGFASRPIPLKAFDSEERVILCSSFSKSLSRDLRIGWILGGRWHNEIVKLKLVSNLASSQSIQLGLSTFIKQGYLKRHLEYKRQLLKKQCDQLVNGIHQYWPENIKFNIPHGGLAIWIEASSNVNMQSLYYELLPENIIITPGGLFTTTKQYKNYLRVSFNHPCIGKRQKALETLGKRIRADTNQ